MSPTRGLRQRFVFGPAVREKYSMHWGRENVDGRFRAVNEEPSGGILNCAGSCDCAFLASRNLYQAIFDFFLRPIPAVVDSDATLRKQGCFNVAVGSEWIITGSLSQYLWIIYIKNLGIPNSQTRRPKTRTRRENSWILSAGIVGVDIVI